MEFGLCYLGILNIMLDGALSRPFPVVSGVPQWFLDPLLFILFVNDFKSTVAGSEFLMFVDDMKIFARNRSEEMQPLVLSDRVLSVRQTRWNLTVKSAQHHYLLTTGDEPTIASSTMNLEVFLGE